MAGGKIDFSALKNKDLGTTYTYKGQNFWDVFMAPALPTPDEQLKNTYNHETAAQAPALAAPAAGVLHTTNALPAPADHVEL